MQSATSSQAMHVTVLLQCMFKHVLGAHVWLVLSGIWHSMVDGVVRSSLSETSQSMVE